MGLHGFGTVDATEAIRLMGSDRAPLLIDIRSASERASQQIPGSIHVPLDTDFESKIKMLDSDAGYLLYCATGVRSGRAVRSLQKNNLIQISDIKGGIGAWTSNGGTITVARADQKGAAI